MARCLSVSTRSASSEDKARRRGLGGHLEMSLSVSWHEVLMQRAQRPPRSRTLTVFMDGVYSNAKSIDRQDPNCDALSHIMNVVT